MKKVLSVIFAVVMLATSFSFAATAVTAQESQAAMDAAYANLFSKTPGDVNSDSAFNAADARAALAYSAGLDNGVDSVLADLDGDGIVTSIDARALLRVSAKLDDEGLLTQRLILDYFNAVANSVKANAYRFRSCSINEVVDIKYDNEELVNKFNNQMNRLPGMTEADKMDFGASLKADIGKITYARTTLNNGATSADYPVRNEDWGSILTMENVSAVEYKENQDFTYISKNQFGTTDLEVTLTGLDAITVYINSETVTDVPEDTSVLNHGKIFTVPQKEDLLKGYKEINDMFASAEIQEMLGTITAGYNNISYYGSYVTLYVDHATNKICAAEYNLKYDFSVAIKMALSSPVLLIDCKGTINVVDTESVNVAYYFQTNYNNLNRG